MRVSTLWSCTLAFLATLAVAVEDQRTVDIFAWPLSAAKPTTLATVSYNSTHGLTKSYTAPALSSTDEIVRVGFTHASGQWSGVATAASHFADNAGLKTLILHVRPDGALYHVGFTAANGRRRDAGAEELAIEVRRTLPGPSPQLNKPVVVDAEGKEEGKEKEKTFFEKYWWVGVLFLVLQLVGGKGGDK